MAECSVYVMGQTDGLKKIGTAHKVSARRNFIQCGAPFEVVVLAAQAMPTEQHAFALEQMCHVDLEPHWVFGEWFSAPLPLIEETIARNIERLQGVLPDFAGTEFSKDALWIHARNALDPKKREQPPNHSSAPGCGEQMGVPQDR